MHLLQLHWVWMVAQQQRLIRFSHLIFVVCARIYKFALMLSNRKPVKYAIRKYKKNVAVHATLNAIALSRAKYAY